MNQHNKQCIYIALLIGIIISVLAYFTDSSHNDNKLGLSILVGIIGVIIIILVYYNYKCPKCGNFNGLKFIKTRILDRDLSYNHFTQEELVGRSFKKSRKGNYYGETEHYFDVDYTTEKMTIKMEDIYQCKFCKKFSNKFRSEKSSRTYKS